MGELTMLTEIAVCALLIDALIFGGVGRLTRPSVLVAE